MPWGTTGPFRSERCMHQDRPSLARRGGLWPAAESCLLLLVGSLRRPVRPLPCSFVMGWLVTWVVVNISGCASFGHHCSRPSLWGTHAKSGCRRAGRGTPCRVATSPARHTFLVEGVWSVAATNHSPGPQRAPVLRDWQDRVRPATRRLTADSGDPTRPDPSLASGLIATHGGE